MNLTERQQDALAGLLAVDYHAWSDLADKLTCGEAEAMADFLHEFGVMGRTDFLIDHATGDDEGDRHRVVLDEDGWACGVETREEPEPVDVGAAVNERLDRLGAAIKSQAQAIVPRESVDSGLDRCGVETREEGDE